MQLTDLDEEIAQSIIEKLRSGLPPRRYASLYSSGMETFVGNVRNRILDRVAAGPGGPARRTSFGFYANKPLKASALWRASN